MLNLKKLGIRCLSVCAAVTMMTAVGAMSGSAASDPATYHNDMKTLEDLEDKFDPYFTQDAVHSRADLPLSGHWKAEDGMIRRINDINKEGATSNIAILVLRGHLFKNFECTYKTVFGDKNWGWTALGFRQQQPGNFFINDGAGVYLDMNGDTRMWGFMPELAEKVGGRVANFDVNKEYTVKVRLVNQDLSMSVDGTELLKLTLPESFLWEGYVSLQSVGNNNAFGDFTITKLNDSGEPEPFLAVDTPVTEAPTQGGDETQAPASTENTTKATEKTTAPTQAKTTAPTVDETENEKDGNGGLSVWAIVAIVAGVVVVAGAVVVVIVIGKKKKAGLPPQDPDASSGQNDA